MARKRKKSDEGGGGDSAGWLTTYTDLTTLLMTFFVLLLSMSVMDENRKREVLNSLVGAFGILPAGRSPIGKPKGIDVRKPSAPMEATDPLNFELLKEIIFQNNLSTEVQLAREDEKFLLRINERVLFQPGTVILRPEMEAYLSELAARLKNADCDIEVKGHTDPYEDLSSKFGPHHEWVLSTQRAQAVSRYLEQQGLATDRISSHGFASHWTMVDSFKYPYLRYKNSRVEIVMGRNETLPTSLIKKTPRPIPFFRYKNFWFRLFPGARDRAQNDAR